MQKGTWTISQWQCNNSYNDSDNDKKNSSITLQQSIFIEVVLARLCLVHHSRNQLYCMQEKKEEKKLKNFDVNVQWIVLFFFYSTFNSLFGFFISNNCVKLQLILLKIYVPPNPHHWMFSEFQFSSNKVCGHFAKWQYPSTSAPLSFKPLWKMSLTSIIREIYQAPNIHIFCVLFKANALVLHISHSIRNHFTAYHAHFIIIIQNENSNRIFELILVWYHLLLAF